MKNIALLFMSGLILFSFAPTPNSTIGGGEDDKLSKLKKEQDKIKENIAFTRELIEETEKKKLVSKHKMLILQRQIKDRESLVEALENETSIVENLIAQQKNNIHNLEGELTQYKNEYAKMVVASYRNYTSLTKLVFIFSSRNFNDLYRRFEYLNRYKNYKKKQAMLIVGTKDQLKKKIHELNKTKLEKYAVIEEAQKEKEQIALEVEHQNLLLSQLKKKERQLKTELNNMARAASKLESAIIAELNKTKNYDINLSREFVNNRGKLPWPVKKARILRKFGEHPDLVYKNIVTVNNGIDLATIAHAEARSIMVRLLAFLVSQGNKKALLLAMASIFQFIHI